MAVVLLVLCALLSFSQAQNATCDTAAAVAACPDICTVYNDNCTTQQSQPVNSTTGKIILQLASFLPYPQPLGILLVPMMQFAINEANNNGSLLQNQQLEILPNQNSNCAASSAAAAGVQIFGKYPFLVGVIGEVCTAASIPLALLSPIYNITQISPASTGTALSDKTQYPYFARTCTSDNFQGYAWASLARYMKWKNVTVLYSQQNTDTAIAQSFFDQAAVYNITITDTENFPSLVGVDMTVQLQSIKSKGVNVIFLAAQCADARTVFRLAAGLGMIGPPYVWVGIDAWMDACTLSVGSGDPNKYTQYALNEAAQNAGYYPVWMKGMIGFRPSSSSSQRTTDVLTAFKTEYNFTDAELNPYVNLAYDAVYSFIYALDYMFNHRSPPWTGPTNTSFRTELHTWIIKNLTFDGISGKVSYDTNGDRQTPYELGFWNQIQSNKREAAATTFGIEVSGTWDPQTNQFLLPTPIIWPDNTTNVPVDITPRTIYHINSAVQVVFMTLACVAMVIVFFFFVGTLIYYNHSRIRAATPTFMLLICFSTELALSIVLVIGVTPSTATCIIPHWFGHVAFYLAFSCLFFKTFRVWYIFRTLEGGKNKGLTKPIKITNMQLLLVVIIPVVGVMIYLACFTALDPPHVVLYEDPNDVKTIIIACQFDNSWIIALYVVEAVFLIFCLILSWQTRKIELLRFNESSHISICIYCLLIIGVILIPNVHWLTSTNDTLFVLESVCIIIACLTINFALFIPKFRAILTKKVDSDQTSLGPKMRPSKVTTATPSFALKE